MCHGARGTALLSSAVACRRISVLLKLPPKNKIKKGKRRKHGPDTKRKRARHVAVGQRGDQRPLGDPRRGLGASSSGLPERERVGSRPRHTRGHQGSGPAAGSATPLPLAEWGSRPRPIRPYCTHCGVSTSRTRPESWLPQATELVCLSFPKHNPEVILSRVI